MILCSVLEPQWCFIPKNNNTVVNVQVWDLAGVQTRTDGVRYLLHTVLRFFGSLHFCWKPKYCERRAAWHFILFIIRVSNFYPMAGFTVTERLEAPFELLTFVFQTVFIFVLYIVLVSLAWVRSWCLTEILLLSGECQLQLDECLFFWAADPCAFQPHCVCVLVGACTLWRGLGQELCTYRCPADRQLVLQQFCPRAKCEPP